MKNQNAKKDAGKPDMRLMGGFLLPLLTAITRVREFGVTKYSNPDNWKLVEPERYKSALMRHIVAWYDDENSTDNESGLNHLYHAACNIAFLIWYDFMKEKASEKPIKSVHVTKMQSSHWMCPVCGYTGKLPVPVSCPDCAVALEDVPDDAENEN